VAWAFGRGRWVGERGGAVYIETEHGDGVQSRSALHDFGSFTIDPCRGYQAKPNASATSWCTRCSWMGCVPVHRPAHGPVPWRRTYGDLPHAHGKWRQAELRVEEVPLAPEHPTQGRQLAVKHADIEIIERTEILSAVSLFNSLTTISGDTSDALKLSLVAFSD
jgi:hypothetical protein